MNHPHPPLSVTTLKRAALELANTNPTLASVVDRLGPPPLWARPPGFATVVHIILEQQVSLASARAAFVKLNAIAETWRPWRSVAARIFWHHYLNPD